MNVYWCQLPMRVVGQSWEPPDPGEPVGPCGFYVAGTRGRAKRLLIEEWAYPHNYYPGACEPEEFVDVRSTLCIRDVERFVDWPEGPVPEDTLTPEDDPWIEDENLTAPEPWLSMYTALERYTKTDLTRTAG